MRERNAHAAQLKDVPSRAMAGASLGHAATKQGSWLARENTMTGSWGLLAIATGAFLAVAALVPLVRAVAVGYGVTDQPRANKLHQSPTPYLGGVAIIVTALGLSAFLGQWALEGGVLLLGALLVGAVGLVDDMRALGPAPRLGVEVVAALMAAAAGARVDLGNGPMDLVLTIAWLVVITNAFNLLDNMDGVAAAIAAVTAVSLAVAANLQGQWLVGGMAALLAGACLGFLVYNWHPARIFLGDAGSLFLGYLLAVIALKLRFPVTHGPSVTAVLLFASPALFDTTLVVISRLRARTPIYLGGTDHTSHRMLARGLSVRTVASVLATASAVLGGLGVAVGRGSLPALVVAAAVAPSAGVALLWFLRQPSLSPRDRSVLPPPIADGAMPLESPT